MAAAVGPGVSARVAGPVAVGVVSRGAGAAWRPAPDRVQTSGDEVLVVATGQALAATSA